MTYSRDAMLRCSRFVALVILVGASTGVLASIVQTTAAPITASGRVELTDPAGDVQPIVYRESVGAGPEKEVPYPGFDVVKLAVASDGKALTFSATLTAPPQRAAFEVVEFYIDADNNRKTGVTHPDAAALAGVEFYGTLEVCLEHQTFGTRCAGTEPKPSVFSAIVTLERFGKDWMFKNELIGLPAAGTVKPPAKTPVKGPSVEATVDYASLGIKPGQTIRLIMREYCVAKIKNAAQGFFPEVTLTVK